MRKPETDIDANAPMELGNERNFRSYCLMKYGSEADAVEAMTKNRMEQLMTLEEYEAWKNPN